MKTIEERFLELLKDYSIEISINALPAYSIISSRGKYLIYPSAPTNELLIDYIYFYKILLEEFNIDIETLEFYLRKLLLKYFKFDYPIRQGHRSIFLGINEDIIEGDKKYLYKNYPTNGLIYKHYKGGLYKVITLAKYREEYESYSSCETDKEKDMVVYQSLTFGSFHVRSLMSWNKFVIPIDRKDKRDICPRFELVNNIN